MHRHTPPTHTSPAAHAGPEPQPQSRAGVWQLSVVPLHVSQATPLGPPHAAGVVPPWHWLFRSQQPFAQLTESQRQPLVVQRWPGRHCVPWHRHVPPAHCSFAPHATHCTPPMPQVEVLGLLHCPPAQHPEAQLIESHPEHTLPTQVLPPPALQTSHATPPLPHSPFRVPAAQPPSPAQQPELHEVASHLHCPPMQCVPMGHAAVAPHRQVPVALQLSAPVALHALHELPGAPHHAAVGGCTQVPPSNAVQQPLPHVAAVQMQRPPSQSVPAGHGPPVVPHTQVPFAQRSASPPHAPQVTPFFPH